MTNSIALAKKNATLGSTYGFKNRPENKDSVSKPLNSPVYLSMVKDLPITKSPRAESPMSTTSPGSRPSSQKETFIKSKSPSVRIKKTKDDGEVKSQKDKPTSNYEYIPSKPAGELSHEAKSAESHTEKSRSEKFSTLTKEQRKTDSKSTLSPSTVKATKIKKKRNKCCIICIIVLTAIFSVAVFVGVVVIIYFYI